jgi:hypothetical protein
VANQDTMKSTQIAELPIPQTPLQARTVHLFPEMNSNLIAVAPLTEAGCTVTFNKNAAVIQRPHQTPIQCPSTTQGIWELPMAVNTKTEQGTAMTTIANTIWNSRHCRIPPRSTFLTSNLNTTNSNEERIPTTPIWPHCTNTSKIPPAIGSNNHWTPGQSKKEYQVNKARKHPNH